MNEEKYSDASLRDKQTRVAHRCYDIIIEGLEQEDAKIDPNILKCLEMVRKDIQTTVNVAAAKQNTLTDTVARNNEVNKVLQNMLYEN